MMVSDTQVNVLIAALYDYHGYDFSGYARASFTRRVSRLLQDNGFRDVSELLAHIRTDPEVFEKALNDLTVNVTEMFRDPHFYRALRYMVLPNLASKPFIRIWHAGCSTGEEVFSMAIVLEELKLLHKTLLYATDISTEVLKKAKTGIFPLRQMKAAAENYRDSGGREDFSSYYIANYGNAKFPDAMLGRMVFSQHNLVADRSFNEFDLILCRNVLIYFDKDLQWQVLDLFDQSLARLGYLALGSKESIRFSGIAPRFAQLDKEKIWKKLG